MHGHLIVAPAEPVHEGGQAVQGLALLEACEQQYGGDEVHALAIADFWPPRGISAQDTPQHLPLRLLEAARPRPVHVLLDLLPAGLVHLSLHVVGRLEALQPTALADAEPHGPEHQPVLPGDAVAEREDRAELAKGELCRLPVPQELPPALRQLTLGRERVCAHAPGHVGLWHVPTAGQAGVRLGARAPGVPGRRGEDLPEALRGLAQHRGE
mmetsp:Transcript_140116/g.390617  ORF Transcript_140116/g.390617 Transcript_140116/m.390617 type:complete len:212 (+) Transcript_140116:548-1183(+)